MKLLLIEDEALAVQRLRKMIAKIAPSATVLADLESVEDTLQWWEQTQVKPDLLLMDIHLADGSAFEILTQLSLSIPIIFITAYDTYALEAFKHNSVDYLLKPIKEAALQQALAKYQSLFGQTSVPPFDYQPLIQELQKGSPTYPKRLLIRFAQQLKAIEIREVAFFYIEERVSFLCTHQGKRYPIDPTLDQLEKMLDPTSFFRVNRQLISNIEAIDQMYTWSKSRIKLQLKPPAPVEALVSTEKSASFKQWLKGT